jgi:hypothetical protein
MLVCYVILRICTAEGKLTERDRANNETVQRAWRVDKME